MPNIVTLCGYYPADEVESGMDDMLKNIREHAITQFPAPDGMVRLEAKFDIPIERHAWIFPCRTCLSEQG